MLVGTPLPVKASVCRAVGQLRLRGEARMQVARRDLWRLTACAGAGTAIGRLVGLGATLAAAEPPHGGPPLWRCSPETVRIEPQRHRNHLSHEGGIA